MLRKNIGPLHTAGCLADVGNVGLVVFSIASADGIAAYYKYNSKFIYINV